MTTRQTNSTILDVIAEELAVAFDSASSTVASALIDNKLSKGSTKKSRVKTDVPDSRPSISMAETAAPSDNRLDHNAVSRTEFTVLQTSVQTLAERMNWFLDRMEKAEDGPRSEVEEVARENREEQPATEAEADTPSLHRQPRLPRLNLQRTSWTR